MGRAAGLLAPLQTCLAPSCPLVAVGGSIAGALLFRVVLEADGGAAPADWSSPIGSRLSFVGVVAAAAVAPDGRRKSVKHTPDRL